MASAGLCFSLSLAPCENQIVLCLKRKGEKGFAYTPIFGKSGCVLKREKKFSVTWFWMLLLKKQTTGRNAKENLRWMNDVEFFFLAALNPIRSLIRVMHRDFTLQVGFFWVLLGSTMGLKLDRAWLKAGLFNVWWGVLCPGESLKLSGERRWSFPLFWRRGRGIIWHCG